MRRLTFSAGGLVESACPGPPLLANLCPRLLCGPLDGGLVALLDTRAATTLLFSAYLHSLERFSGEPDLPRWVSLADQKQLLRFVPVFYVKSNALVLLF